MSETYIEEEVELIRSSLMPEESLQESETISKQFTISSTDSPYRINFSLAKQTKADVATLFQIKSDAMAREEAVGWAQWVQEKIDESWNEAVDTG